MNFIENAMMLNKYVNNMEDGEQKETFSKMMNNFIFTLNETMNEMSEQSTQMKNDYIELNEKWKERSKDYDGLLEKYEECMYNAMNTKIRFINLLSMAGVNDAEKYL